MANGEPRSLEYTPTWVVTVVCFIIVLISFGAERGLRILGKVSKIFLSKYCVKEYLFLQLVFSVHKSNFLLFWIQFFKHKEQESLFEALQEVKGGL